MGGSLYLNYIRVNEEPEWGPICLEKITNSTSNDTFRTVSAIKKKFLLKTKSVKWLRKWSYSINGEDVTKNSISPVVQLLKYSSYIHIFTMLMFYISEWNRISRIISRFWSIHVIDWAKELHGGWILVAMCNACRSILVKKHCHECNMKKK